MTLNEIKIQFTQLSSLEKEDFLAYAHQQTFQDESKLSDAWNAELDKRWEEISHGKVVCINASEIVADIKKAFGFESQIPS